MLRRNFRGAACVYKRGYARQPIDFYSRGQYLCDGV